MSPDIWQPVYIGLGSNLNDPVRQLSVGLERLAALPKTRVVLTSQLVRNPAWGKTGQADFVNAVAGLLTMLSPLCLLDALQEIELLHGRERGVDRWGPRTLDLDILVYADRVIDSDRLTVPHPYLGQRNFVLGPLLEIAPNLHVPGVGEVAQLATQIDLKALEVVQVQHR